MPDILFLAGPSGAGKTHVARILEAIHHFLHIDIDQHHGFKANELRPEWHKFSERLEPKSLAATLLDRISQGSYVGAVLSFPSTRVLTASQIQVAGHAGICTVVLWGAPADCKAAVLKREGILDEARYERSNRAAFVTYGRSDYSSIRLEAFGPDGLQKSSDDLIKIIRERLANNRLQPSAVGGMVNRRG